MSHHPSPDSKRYEATDILPHLSITRPHTVRLGPSDRSWNPASTNTWNVIRGPALVTYTKFSDGGIRATVAPLEISAELRDAIVAIYLETGEQVNTLQLARRLGVSESTIYKRLRMLDNDIDGCNYREGINGRKKGSFLPMLSYLRKLLLEARSA